MTKTTTTRAKLIAGIEALTPAIRRAPYSFRTILVNTVQVLMPKIPESGLLCPKCLAVMAAQEDKANLRVGRASSVKAVKHLCSNPECKFEFFNREEEATLHDREQDAIAS